MTGTELVIDLAFVTLVIYQALAAMASKTLRGLNR
jgi:hypothetical protein